MRGQQEPNPISPRGRADWLHHVPPDSQGPGLRWWQLKSSVTARCLPPGMAAAEVSQEHRLLAGHLLPRGHRDLPGTRGTGPGTRTSVRGPRGTARGTCPDGATPLFHSGVAPLVTQVWHLCGAPWPRWLSGDGRHCGSQGSVKGARRRRVRELKRGQLRQRQRPERIPEWQEPLPRLAGESPLTARPGHRRGPERTGPEPHKDRAPCRRVSSVLAWQAGAAGAGADLLRSGLDHAQPRGAS